MIIFLILVSEPETCTAPAAAPAAYEVSTHPYRERMAAL